MMLSDQALDALLKRLHLANTRRAWRELTRRAEHEEWSYRDFLALLVSEEIAHRQQTRLHRLVRRARFPFLKTIDDFNFIHQSTVRLSLLGSALAPEFVTDGRCLILSGKPGRGKTHLAVAIAYRAIQNGFDGRFVTAAELIDDLSAAFRSGRLAEVLATYIHPGVLIVDEVGYLTYGTDAANMLFHVVNDRHRKRRAMIFTTNKAVSAWGRVLHDEDLAHAIVDRILERGRMLTLDGPSMRTKHLGLDDPTSSEAPDQPARISGIQAPEFPEPTALGEHERKEVTDRFPIDQWPTMPLERYALGQDTSDDTFCQWMEYRSQHLGSIRGGSARKLIIYKHKDKPGWYFDPEYKDEQEAWVAVRQAFVEAFEKAKAGDWNTIDDLTPLSGGPALRLKTLRVYFPTDVLPIASKHHLRHFLRVLERPEADDRSLDVVRLNRALLEAVRSRSEFEGWSTPEVERFFYHWADPRDQRRIVKIAPGENASAFFMTVQRLGSRSGGNISRIRR